MKIDDITLSIFFCTTYRFGVRATAWTCTTMSPVKTKMQGELHPQAIAHEKGRCFPLAFEG